MDSMSGRRRRKPAPEPERRGIFGGNLTVRYGLVVVMLSMLFMMMYNRMFESSRLDGPIDDIFRKRSGNLAIVYSTTGEGSDDALADYAGRVSKLLGEKLSEKIPAFPDTGVKSRVLKRKSLLLYGPVRDNRVTRELGADFPFRFEGGRLGWGENHWLRDPDWRLVFIWPNPLSRGQYVLVYTASDADRVIGINFIESPNFLPHDTTDYVLAAGDSILAGGYFEKDGEGHWKLPAGALASLER